MGTSVWDKGKKTYFEPLRVDFEIPEDLQEEIDAYIYNLNYENGDLADCYSQEIRTSLNGYEDCDDLTSDQILILRRYYCLGGMYDEDS